MFTFAIVCNPLPRILFVNIYKDEKSFPLSLTSESTLPTRS